MSLEIHQQYPIIGANIRAPLLKLHNEKPDLEISTNSSKLEIESTPPDLYIDQSVCYTSGLHMNIDEFARYFAGKGRQACLEGTARRAREGERMVHIENPGAFKEIIASRQKAWSDYPYLEMNPAPGPEIEFTVHPLQINYIPTELSIDVAPGYVENNFQPGDVEIYLRQKNKIEIEYTGSNVDQMA